MLLNYFSLSKTLIVLVVSFIFVKIYQHNLVIKLNYEKQRFERIRATLEKERDDLSVDFLVLCNPEKLCAMAKEQWHMKAVDPAYVRTIPSYGKMNFLETTSSTVITKKSTCELVMSNTRRGYACT